jgi:pyruvate-formate lyase-activating enzyme
METKNRKKSKTLYEITMRAYKHFYVEAASQEEAIEFSREEAGAHFNDFDWEHEETRAELTDERTAERVRNERKMILDTSKL